MRDFSGYAKLEVLTLQDLVHKMTMRCGITTASPLSNTKLIHAIQNAIRSLHAKHRWNYYRRQTRFTTSPTKTMEVIYDATGGVEDNLVTITSGDFWPQDATYGDVWIGNKSYRILKRISDVQATLEPDFTPIDDYVGGVTWKRRSYRFARNINRVEYVHNITINRQLTSIPPGEFNASSYNPYVSGYTRHFTWQNYGNEFGASELILYPAPVTAEIIEVSAAVLPITPKTHSITGTDLTGSSGSITVTCAGGSFTNKLVGEMIRISATAVSPTGFNSEDYTHQAFIVAVPSSTTLTISEPLPASYSSCGYLISSPIDIEVSVMLEAIEDEAFYQYTKNHNHSGTQEAAMLAQKSLIEAMVRDSKTGEDSHNAGPSWYDPLRFSGVVQVDSSSAYSDPQPFYQSSVPSNSFGSDGDKVFINAGDLNGAIYKKTSGAWVFIGNYTLVSRTTNPSLPLPTGFQFRLISQSPSSNNGIWQYNGTTFIQLTAE